MRAGAMMAAAVATTCLVAGCGTASGPAVRSSAVEHRAAPRLVVNRTAGLDVPGTAVGVPAAADDGGVLLPVSVGRSSRLSTVRLLRPDGSDTVVARTATRRGEIGSTAYADGWVAWVEVQRVGRNVGDSDPKPWRLVAESLASGTARTLAAGTAAPGMSTPELSGDGDTFYWTEADRSHGSKLVAWSTTRAAPPTVLARHLAMSSPSVAGDRVVYLGDPADGAGPGSAGDCYAVPTSPAGRHEPRALTSTSRAMACVTNGSRLVYELQHPPRSANDGPPEGNPWQVRSQALGGSTTSASRTLEQGYLPGETPVVGAEFAAYTTFHGSGSVEVASLSAKRSSALAVVEGKELVRWLAARGDDLFVVSQDDHLAVHATFFTVR